MVKMRFPMYHLDQQDKIPSVMVVIEWKYLTTVKITGYPNRQIFGTVEYHF